MNINLRNSNRLKRIERKNKLEKTNPTTIKGKLIVITGTLGKMTRYEANDIISTLGGILQTNITKLTNFVVHASPFKQTSKINKAKKYGIPIIRESEFYNIIDNST